MKKLMNKINFAIVAMMMIVSSCAKDSDPILDTIPADAEVVSMVNVNTSMTHLGIEISEEGIKYPESMKCVESILDMAVSKEDKKNLTYIKTKFPLILKSTSSL